MKVANACLEIECVLFKYVSAKNINIKCPCHSVHVKGLYEATPK